MNVEIYHCRKQNCLSQNVKIEIRDNGQIGIKCNICNAYTFWPLENSKNRKASHQNLVKEIGLNYCQWCLRYDYELPQPQRLEAHHIIEYAEGGTNDKNNILILCTACHSQCHHNRVYYGHYKIKHDRATNPNEDH